MPDLLLSAEGIGKRFGRNTVLKAASFWVYSGRISALLGRNGCGKTTLIRCGVGEVRMDYGLVRVMGEVQERPRLWRLAGKGVWFMDQDCGLPPHLPVGRLLDITTRKAGSDAAQWVDVLKLGELVDSLVPQLSRGERKRAGFALALLSGARCLVLDEPFEGIEPKDQDLISECLALVRGRGVGVIMTGHNARAILEVADSVTWCVAGTTHDLGTVEEATGHEQFVREYLGPGYDSH